jgi:hypothetical protein
MRENIKMGLKQNEWLWSRFIGLGIKTGGGLL